MTVFLIILLLISLASCFFVFKPYNTISCTLSIFVIVFSVVAYYFLGDAQGLINYQRAQVELKTIYNPQKMINQLQQYLSLHSDSAQAWFLLGRLYSDTQQHLLAQAAFEKAYILQPSNASYAAAVEGKLDLKKLPIVLDLGSEYIDDS